MMIQEQFEPMTVGQILDRAFRLYRQNFVRFIAIVAVIQVPMFLVSLVVGRITISYATQAAVAAALGQQPSPAAVVLPILAALIVALVATSLCSGALVKSISSSYLGQDVTVGGAYRFVLPKFLTLVVASFIVWFLIGAVALVLLFIGGCLGGVVLAIIGSGGGFGLFPAAVILIILIVPMMIPPIILAVIFALTSQAIVLEDKGVFGGMSRSRQLASWNKWKVFLVGLAVILIGLVIWRLFAWVGQLAAPKLDLANPMPHLLVKQLLSLIANTLVTPISAGAFILLYYDLRIRKEGFDLEMLAQSLGAARTAETVSDAGERPTE